MKTLKFKEVLIPSILSGEKDTTWRLFDEKDLKEGDELLFINKNTMKEFSKAMILSVRKVKLGELEAADLERHEEYESEEKMYEVYKSYYGDDVGPNNILKIVKFKLRK